MSGTAHCGRRIFQCSTKLKNGKERNRVAIKVGTLVTRGERMLECIHMKF
jgi:hypothetical protein